MSESKEPSVPQSSTGFIVEASPFNPVKFDLGLIVVIALVVWFGHDSLSEHPLVQLAILMGYGLISMAWLVFRIRRISRQLAKASRVQEEI